MESEVVRVTAKGQATIPVSLRRKHGIPAPGLVRFGEVGGHIVLEPVQTPRAMRGVLKRAFGRESAATLLRRDRAHDKRHEARKAE